MADGDGGPSKNFRSAYYEKLGFTGSDEKNYLDLLIASSPSLDIEKLNGLCERCELDKKSISNWKILLGVDCGRNNPFDDYENVRRVRTEHFQLLKHHLEVLLKHNALAKSRHLMKTRTNNQLNVTSSNGGRGGKEETKSTNQQQEEENISINLPNENQIIDKYKLIVLMYLLEAGRLETSNIDAQMNSEHCRKLLAMATFFVNVSNDLQEAFFLFRNFTNKILI